MATMTDVNWKTVILQQIADRKKRRRDIAETYGILLRTGLPLEEYAEINKAIIDRWSFAGLEWIKTQAWR